MTDEGGPFREGDPVLSKLHEIGRTQAAHGNALGELLTNTRQPNVGVFHTLVPWFGWPMALAIALFGVGLLGRYGNEGCAARDREEHREKQADAATELRDRERFCAAIGLRYAGMTPVAVFPEHRDSRGYNVPADVFYGVVCGNGHGDGMYVGVDGHLHALKEPSR